MLYVTPQLFALATSGELEDLHAALQNAIAIEHATMPPYLYALYSIGGPETSTNVDIAAPVFEIVMEEMLHMLLASNILKAISGRPLIHDPSFVMNYPGPIPGIDSSLKVPLKPFSKELVENVFMRIEDPEHVLDFPVRAMVSAPPGQPPRTIGEFYRQIRSIFEEPGADSLITRPQSQFNDQPSHGRFDEKQTISTAADVVAAINVIVEQGEGTSSDPFFRGHENTPDDDRLAHYYRFAELVRGRIKKNPAPPAEPEANGSLFLRRWRFGAVRCRQRASLARKSS